MLITRQEQNNIILHKIAEKLGDKPNVQAIISKTFTDWFQQLAQTGLQMIQQQPASPNGGGGGGGAGGGEQPQ